jgi:hypothetical protein
LSYLVLEDGCGWQCDTGSFSVVCKMCGNKAGNLAIAPMNLGEVGINIFVFSVNFYRIGSPLPESFRARATALKMTVELNRRKKSTPRSDVPGFLLVAFKYVQCVVTMVFDNHTQLLILVREGVRGTAHFVFHRRGTGWSLNDLVRG